MAHFQGYWADPRNSEMVAAGDTWARGNTGITWTFDGTSWWPTNPPDAFAGLLIAGGTTNWHLAKGGTQAFNLKWVEPTDGILFQYNPPAVSDTWEINHRLNQRFVSVDVVPAVQDTWFAEEGTIIKPRVDFRTVNTCICHFAYPLQGTALVRR